MHATRFPALVHCILQSVKVFRFQRPEVRIPPAAPRAASFWTLLFLFCMKLNEILQGADSNSLCPPSASRRAKTVLRTVFKARLGESPPAAPRAASFWMLLFLFCMKLNEMLQGADSNSCIGDRRLLLPFGFIKDMGVDIQCGADRGACRTSRSNRTACWFSHFLRWPGVSSFGAWTVFLCGFQPVPFVIVAAGYYDERTVLPSFSDACHFDHSAVY